LLKVLLSDPSERPEGFLVVLPRVHYRLKEWPAQARWSFVSWVVASVFRLSLEFSLAPQLVLAQVLESHFDSDLNLQFVQWQQDSRLEMGFVLPSPTAQPHHSAYA
jgi:hypothetical protein